MFEPYAKYNIGLVVERDADMQEASPVCFQSNPSGVGADGDKDFRFEADPPSLKLPPTFDFGVTSRQGSRLG